MGLQARKNIIDSLNILTYNKITIIDYSGTDGGEEVALSYVFYNDTCSRALIRGSSIRYLSNKDPMDDIMQKIYNFFNRKIDSKTMVIDDELPFGTYNVTTVCNCKIEYYEIYNNTVIKRS